MHDHGTPFAPVATAYILSKAGISQPRASLTILRSPTIFARTAFANYIPHMRTLQISSLPKLRHAIDVDIRKTKSADSVKSLRFYFDAVERTRTSTGIHPLPPQDSVSAIPPLPHIRMIRLANLNHHFILRRKRNGEP